MLEGLDKVDWGSIDVRSQDTKYPERIPHILRKLLSDNANVRLQHLEELEWELIYSEIGDLPNQAMMPTLPFIFELLLYDKFQEKVNLLNFLSRVLSETSPQRKYHEQHENSLCYRFFDILEKNQNVFISLLNHDSPIIRVYATTILSHTNLEESHFRLLYHKVRTETNEDAKVLIARHLVEFYFHNRDFGDAIYRDIVSILLIKFSSMETGSNREILAYGITKLMREKTPLQAISTLVDSWSKSDRDRKYIVSIAEHDVELAQEDIPAWSESHIGKVIYRCGFDLGYPALYRLAKSSNSNFGFYVSLLDLLFDKQYYEKQAYLLHRAHNKYATIRLSPKRNGKKLSQSDIVPVSTLNSQQYDFLKWLLDDDRFWEHDHDLMVWYGLPASRDGLRQFLKKYSGTIE